jgi:hypothetical protein
MAFRIFRAFQSAKSDGPDATEIQPSHWNADLSTLMSVGKILGRTTTSPDPGPAEEIDAPVLVGRMSANRAGANQTGGTGGAFNKVQLDTEAADVNGWYDNVTNFRYTPQSPGVYLVFASVSVNSGATGESPAVALRKNGSLEIEGPFISTVGNTVVVVCPIFGMVVMNGTTDYLELFAYLPTGVTVINGQSSRTYMTAIKLCNAF